MVAILVRLRLLVLWNTLKRSPWQAVWIVLGTLYALGLIGLALVGLVVLGFTSPEVARTALILAGSALILGWIVVPLLTVGVDQTLEPAKLVTFPIPLRTLILGLTVSGIIGIPGAATLLAALGSAAAWWRHPAAVLASIVCAVLGVITCIVASRTVTTLGTGLGAGRRYREISGIIVMIPLMLLGPIIVSVTAGLGDIASVLPRLADALSWTPLGAAWAVPGDIAVGNWLVATAKLLIALATIAVLVLIWASSLRAALVSPPSDSSRARRSGKLGFFTLYPASPTGAVAARALTYWIRDPRYARQLIVIPLVVVLMIFYSNLNNSSGLVSIAPALIALVLSISIYTDVSYDGTAFAMHLASGVSGVADRAGRVLAIATFAVPLIVLVTVASVWVSEAWRMLPAMLGLSLGVLLTGFGVASVTSATVVFPVPQAGDNPFKSPPGAAVPSLLASFGSWVVIGILALPELTLTIVSAVTGQMLYGWLSLATAVVLGTLFLVLGVRIGGRTLDRRGPELLARLRS